MPTSGRKSSFGGRRGPDKPHEPYREAGLIGRKTGQPVPMVEPDSDDIEPFKEVIGMAKARTPKPNPNKKRKVSVPKKSMVFEDEDSDEQSMELASAFLCLPFRVNDKLSVYNRSSGSETFKHTSTCYTIPS